ncbi:MAG: pyridoxamine 5'-phosphate oxidase family protein [Anaerolineae bacterium]|nr:pyridoxamine 5'-phosphate oxidase family protein [Anaerolineae bacterium]
MAKDYPTTPYTEVRRKDRQVTDETWIRGMLNAAATGTLATVYEGQPFLNSNLYVYDEGHNAIYLHTAHLGRTRANLEAEDKVCFTVMEMGRLLPAEQALEFSVEYASVVVFGRGRVVTDPTEAEYGLQRLLDKYAPHLRPGEHYRPIMPEELKRTAVYRIHIDQWSGKRKIVAADFPGAYHYEPPTFIAT